MKKTLRIFMLTAVMVVLAACGGNGETDVAQEEGATQITAAVENASNPLSFTNDEGELDGYEVELIEALDEEMDNFSITIESVDASATEVGLDTGKYQFIGGGLYKTPEREERYLFPEENSGVSIVRIYTRADDDSIQGLDDLAGKRVHPVTPRGGIYNLLTDYNEANPDNQIDIQLGEAGDFAQRFQALHEGNSDAVVMPSNLGADEIIDELDLNVKAVEEPVQVNPTYFMLAQDQEELKTSMDEVLRTLKEDGTLSELSEKWYGEDIFQFEPTND